MRGRLDIFKGWLSVRYFILFSNVKPYALGKMTSHALFHKWDMYFSVVETYKYESYIPCSFITRIVLCVQKTKFAPSKATKLKKKIRFTFYQNFWDFLFYILHHKKPPETSISYILNTYKINYDFEIKKEKLSLKCFVMQ